MPSFVRSGVRCRTDDKQGRRTCLSRHSQSGLHTCEISLYQYCLVKPLNQDTAIVILYSEVLTIIVASWKCVLSWRFPFTLNVLISGSPLYLCCYPKHASFAVVSR